MTYGEKLKEKLKEAVSAVLPIMLLVLVLCFSVAPLSSSVLLCFLMGGVMVMIGMMFFTLGAEMAMTPMGEKIGTSMTQSRNVFRIVLLAFILGFIITISEPDLQVLAAQVPSIPNRVLIFSVAAGVGLFLVIALLRMLFSIALPNLLVCFYVVVFVLAFFVPDSFLCVAFDSGGVASGPMTATFLLPLAQGACQAVGGNVVTDAFGVVAMVAMTPLITIQLLGLVSQWKKAHAPHEPMLALDMLDDDAIIEL